MVDTSGAGCKTPCEVHRASCSGDYKEAGGASLGHGVGAEVEQ